jgi:hypothetical protein
MKSEPQDRPVGYITQPIARRLTRPLHNRRHAILEAAEAAFKKKPAAAPTDSKPEQL